MTPKEVQDLTVLSHMICNGCNGAISRLYNWQPIGTIGFTHHYFHVEEAMIVHAVRWQPTEPGSHEHVSLRMETNKRFRILEGPMGPIDSNQRCLFNPLVVKPGELVEFEVSASAGQLWWLAATVADAMKHETPFGGVSRSTQLQLHQKLQQFHAMHEQALLKDKWKQVSQAPIPAPTPPPTPPTPSPPPIRRKVRIPR